VGGCWRGKDRVIASGVAVLSSRTVRGKIVTIIMTCFLCKLFILTGTLLLCCYAFLFDIVVLPTRKIR
jgi:hypothetical protein